MSQLVIVGARLVDARSNEPLAGDTIVVADDGRITEVGASRSAIPDGALVVDAGGRSAVPGLIDCHVHLSASHALLQDLIQRSYTEYVAQMLTCGRAFLELGVTTVRDAGGAPAGIKRVFARGEFPGPRLQVSVMPMSITGGHGDAQTPAGVDLTGDLPAIEMPRGIADGVDEVRRVVRQQIRAGADWIKVMATGGVYSLMDAPDAVQYTVDEMRVMVDEADSAGIRGVMAHAENASGHQERAPGRDPLDRPRRRARRRGDRPDAGAGRPAGADVPDHRGDAPRGPGVERRDALVGRREGAAAPRRDRAALPPCRRAGRADRDGDRRGPRAPTCPPR